MLLNFWTDIFFRIANILVSYFLQHFTFFITIVFQRLVHHWSKWCGEAHECERPTCGPLCRRNPSSGEGVPVCGDPWRGLSSQLDPALPDSEFVQRLDTEVQMFLFIPVSDLLIYAFPVVFFVTCVFRMCREKLGASVFCRMCIIWSCLGNLAGLTLFFRSNQHPKDPRSTLKKSTEEVHNVQI